MVHQREQPGAQVATRTPEQPLAACPLQGVLHQIVSGPGVTREHARVAPQGGHLVDDPLAIHGARNGLQGLAARQTWFTPSPVLSPGLVSLIQ